MEQPPIPYASWGQRFGAWLIDILVVWGSFIIVAIALTFSIAGTDGEEGQGFVTLATLAFLPFWPSYFALFHGRERGQTLGKRAVSIAVRDESTLGRLSYGRAFVRAYLMFLFSVAVYVPFIIDVLWPLWDGRRQALHDKAVRSIVVRV